MPKEQSKDGIGTTQLTKPREIAAEQIRLQIAKGLALTSGPIVSSAILAEKLQEKSRWHRYNTELLGRLFDTSYFVAEYNLLGVGAFRSNPTFEQRVGEFIKEVQDGINLLKSIEERLQLIPEAAKNSSGPDSDRNLEPTSRRVFVVHGHNHEIKESVARTLSKLLLEPVILWEETSSGRTNIEKFEQSSNSAFAVVLLTADDVGAPRATPKALKPRARQNVILELGYFIARLGRTRVCTLYEEGVEIPSDFHGVGYLPIDSAGAWKFQLAREIKAAGIDVDLNLL